MVLFEYYCRKKGISCISSIEDNILIKADPDAINRITNNLIENAIKFTDPGECIEIALKAINQKISFSVKDTGIGIAPELQKEIFKPYYQINHKKTHFQGMGLGLPLVKKVADSLGAQISIDSNPAITLGTNISITFDRFYLSDNETITSTEIEDKPSAYNIEAIDNDNSSYFPNRQSILLVEDHKPMLSFLSKKLNNKYNVFCSLNGAEALKKLRDLKIVPDLIISDIMMDKMGGFNFAHALAEQDIYSHVPIIFLSAKLTHADKLKGLRLGAIDIVQKPFSFEILSQKIETVLDKIAKQKKAFLNSTLSALKIANSAGSPSEIEQNCKLYGLTHREIDIVKLIEKGFKYRMIAEALFISDRTVAKHVQNIFEKTEVSSKVELLHKLGL
jgi:DNA-binding NarL/FixJ family response regulator/anti-sigma regulatory factor (Ser/Thr protein kinase)